MSERTCATKRPPALPGKRSSLIVLASVVFAILLIPLIALLIWYVSVRTSNSSVIRELEAEARQRGEPLTLAELQAKYPPIPDEENAAVPLMALWEAEDPHFWRAFLNDERPLPEPVAVEYDPALPYLGSDARRIPRGPLDSNSLAAADSYRSATASHLERVRRALRRPYFRFPVKLEDGPNALLPHLNRLKTEAQSFSIVALVASERGDNDTAIMELENAARTGQILGDEPVLMSQLVRIACLAISVDGFEQLLSRQSLTSDELERLRILLEQSNLHGVAQTSLVNERAEVLCMLDPDIIAQAAASSPSNDDEERPEQTAFKIRAGYGLMQSIGFLDFDRRLILETFQRAIALAKKETPESLTDVEELFGEVKIKAHKFPPKLFSGLLLPALERIPHRYASYEARRQAAMTAVSIECYRLRNQGQIPDGLASLVPAYLSAVPQDPFDGRPLRFHKLERGYVVYSIGRDREDNGGKEHTRGSVEHTDLTFIVDR